MTHVEIGESVIQYNFQIEDFHKITPNNKCPSFEFPLSVNGLRTKWEVVVRPFQKENDNDNYDEPLECRNVSLEVKCLWSSVTSPSISIVMGISGRDELEKILRPSKREDEIWRGKLISRISITSLKLLQEKTLNFYLQFFISSSTIARSVDSLACLATELGLLRERTAERADVLLITSDKKEIPAHKCILRARSSLLKAQENDLQHEEEPLLLSPASDKENLKVELGQNRRSDRSDSLSSGYHSQALTSPEPSSDTSYRENSPSCRVGAVPPLYIRSQIRSKRTMTPTLVSPTKRLTTFSTREVRISPVKPSGARGPTGLPASPRGFRVQRESPSRGRSPFKTTGQQTRPSQERQSPRAASTDLQRRPLTPTSSCNKWPSPSAARRHLDFTPKPSYLAASATSSPSCSSALFKPPITITPPSPPPNYSHPTTSSVAVDKATTEKSVLKTFMGYKDDFEEGAWRIRSTMKVSMSASITKQLLTWLYEGELTDFV
ncbi:uncharacterized protein LOC143037787 [Oratosquilla oratoria]|uniref:uncharacterized protein LOC143037787 n=1 Tax=Oratosquilla oratoria TaxID=337810 RepID=UPI003F764C25